jgi:predicted O-methyltransferase YrrM
MTTKARSTPRAPELARAALKVGADQKLGEISRLVSLIKRRVLRTVVEIGTKRGGTFFLWCKVAEPDAVVVSIDLPGGHFGGGYKEEKIPYFRSFGRPGQSLHFLRADSHAPDTRAALREILNGRAIDFLMIDGDHTYDGVRQDFELYSPLVKRNGLIAFHDIVHHERVPDCQVDRFWNEVKTHYRYREFVTPGGDRGWGEWGGIGVLYFDPPAARA